MGGGGGRIGERRGEIIELSQSTVFMVADGDGRDHRTAWAGAGDGVLFFDVDNDGAISNSHQYIFTEWAEGATDDIDGLQRAFDRNGALTSTGARWGKVIARVDIQNWLQDRLDRRESA